MTPEDDLCPSCNQSIGISVTWCAACAAWFKAVKEGYCTVDPYEVAAQWYRDWMANSR